MQITMNQLRGLVVRLNQLTGENVKPYSRPETAAAGQRLTANVGTYVLDGAYGGWQLARICNEGGGQSLPLGQSRGTKRETYDRINAFILGFEEAKRKEAKKEAIAKTYERIHNEERNK